MTTDALAPDAAPPPPPRVVVIRHTADDAGPAGPADRVETARNSAKVYAREADAAVRGFVADKPLAGLAVGLAAGALLGWLVKR